MPRLKMGYDALSGLYEDLGRRQGLLISFEQALVDSCSGEVAVDGHVIGSLSEPCQYNGQRNLRFYAVCITSGSYARPFSRRSKNSCITSAGTRSPMDLCGRKRL